MSYLSKHLLWSILVLVSSAHAQSWSVETVTKGLDHPWAVAFLPQGGYLVTERPGQMRVITPQGQLLAPIEGVPAVDARGQGGLLDLILDGDFVQNRTLYFCYAEKGSGGNGTALARAQLSPDLKCLQNLKVLFSQLPKVESTAHFGCRIVIGADGHLFMAMGERAIRMQAAQALDNHLGKIIRITKDGAVPKDNPFVGQPGALPEIWSYGHRNPQGATLAPNGQLWEMEHGPQGGDEINLIRAGKNYGWPTITYGENYGGGKIGEGITEKAGMEQPLHHWTPSIAPSGIAFLTSDRYGTRYKGQLFVGSLKFAFLDRIEWAQGRVVNEQVIRIGERVRDVRQGPDGYLYLLTDQVNGRLLRLTLK